MSAGSRSCVRCSPRSTSRMPMTQRRALLSVVWARVKLRLRGLDWKERRASQIAPETLLRLDVLKAASHSLALIDNIRAADFNARWLLLALRVGESTRCALALSTEVMFQGSQGGRGSSVRVACSRPCASSTPRRNDPRLRAFMLMSGRRTRVLGVQARARRRAAHRGRAHVPRGDDGHVARAQDRAHVPRVHDAPSRRVGAAARASTRNTSPTPSAAAIATC